MHCWRPFLYQTAVGNAFSHMGALPQLVADHLGIPCTEHTYEDVQLAMDAVAGGATSNAGAVELHALRKKLSGECVSFMHCSHVPNLCSPDA